MNACKTMTDVALRYDATKSQSQNYETTLQNTHVNVVLRQHAAAQLREVVFLCVDGMICCGAREARRAMGDKPHNIGQHSSLNGCEHAERQGGGIEPLHVSMPHELKSCPSTSPTHPGRDDRDLATMPLQSRVEPHKKWYRAARGCCAFRPPATTCRTAQSHWSLYHS